ncbi:DoxX family protein [Micromonospora sp. NPDC126480]|uniref:DoxX family protein n=1 Tax=Micromonospora sp. NPDC126480 TaxID=3155312 RepID=UPI003321A4F9
MSVTQLVVTLLAAAMVAFSGVAVLLRASWVVQPLAEYGVPRSWWPWLGTAKAAGAAGLLVGLVLPVIGTVAGLALVAYFTGAVITVLRARAYSHVPFPLIYAAPVVVALGIGTFS